MGSLADGKEGAERIELPTFLNNNYFIEDEHSLRQKQANRKAPFPTNREGQPVFQRTASGGLHSPPEEVAVMVGSKLLRIRSILPTFNADGKYYTYAFQLPSSPVDNETQMLEEHQKRACEAEAEHSELVPLVLGSGCRNPGADTNTAESAEDTMRTTRTTSSPTSTTTTLNHRATSNSFRSSLSPTRASLERTNKTSWPTSPLRRPPPKHFLSWSKRPPSAELSPPDFNCS